MLIRYFLCVALALFFATILRLKKAFFKNFAVGQENEAPRLMSIGGDGDAAATCAACGNPGAKKCSRCKSVSYCSKECQSKHWEADHSLKCKKLMLSDEIVLVSSGSGAFRRKASGFSPIALVPAGRTCKVLQCSKKILFSYNEFVKLFNWDKPGFPPCGLINNGNSCFANVVLQCLACTRPLIAYFLEKDHSRECIKKQSSWCLLCELQTHFERGSGSLRPFQPINILSRMSSIGGNLGYGRQEDAHEFMRFVINTMQSDFLYEFGGEKSLDPSTQETTLIQHIFGGLLQSQVICTKCNTVSSRYENMMDLTVEIQGEAQSLEKCLEQFTVKEWLDGENMYECDGCNAYVKACKQLTVNQAPNILTIALKRFESGMYGKLNKTVTFPMNLDLTPYMSETGDGTDLYKLYAVVVHVDLLLNASYLGHYICYIKDYHGHWYRINDSMVTVVDEEVVLAEDAYMLLYSRRNARQEPLFKPLEPTKKQQLAEVGPESSSISNAMVAVSSVQHLPPDVDSQSNHSTPEKPMDISLLRDMQQESELSTKISTGRENGSHDLDLVVPVEVNPVSVCQDLGFVDLDDPKITYSRSRDVDEDKPGFFSVVTEDDSPLEPMQCNLIPPAMLSSVEAYALECQVSPVSSDGDCHMEEDRRLSSNTESTCEIIVHKMAETSTAPITALSSELETLEDLRQNPEHSVTVCGTSGFSNGVIWVDDASLPAAHKETQAFPLCLENSLREKTKPFLGSPPRSKLLDREATPQIEKVYSYSNVHGHAKHLESFHRNGRSTIPSSESSFLSPGFLNKCYKRSLNKSKIAKEPNKPNRPCKTNFNGHEMSCLEGKSQLSAGCKGPSLPTCLSLEGLGSLSNRIKD